MAFRFENLTARADRYQTYKGRMDGDRSLYTEQYAMLFEPFRLTNFNLLELGLLGAPKHEEEVDSALRQVDRIPSVEMWLSFFPQAEIYGFDFADFSCFQKPRFSFMRGDLSNNDDLSRVASFAPAPRIIIDHGLHASFHQQRAFLKLFPTLAPGGFYIIENLHHSPVFESSLPVCRNMTEIVEDYLETGVLTFDVGDAEDVAFLQSNILQSFVHCSARGHSEFGPKFIVFQKAMASGGLPMAQAEKTQVQCRSEGDDHWLTPAWLTTRSFDFRAAKPERHLASGIRFEPDGRISGTTHPNESGWRLQDGRLFILNQFGNPTCVATPMAQPDGSNILAGPFLAEPDVVHRFEEMPVTPGLPEVSTFDLFDTLVARRCHDPIAIFRNVEAQSGVAEFARIRQTVEAQLWHGEEYAFDDIYRALGEVSGWAPALLDRLRMMELAEEWANLFPIKEMVSRVGPDDMIVSDMYLPYDFLRRLVDEVCGLPGRSLHLSSHGKTRGKIWPKLLATHRIRRHYGDNGHSDVESPRRAGIAAQHVRISLWTPGEQILRQLGLEDFARAVREARLTYEAPDLSARAAAWVQFEINLPLLIVASIDMLQQAAAEQIDVLLMGARDCNLWVHLMQVLAPFSPNKPIPKYFLASRVLLLSGSAEYLAYFESMAGKRNLLVDISGTGRSPEHFIGTNDKQASTSLYLVAGGGQVVNFVRGLAPARHDVQKRVLSTQNGIERVLIETLNMSLEGRAMRMEFDGGDFIVSAANNEFGPRSQAIISSMRQAFFAGLEMIKRDIRKLPEKIAPEKLAEAASALIAMTPGFAAVSSPILTDINIEEQNIAAVAKSEQERNKPAAE